MTPALPYQDGLDSIDTNTDDDTNACDLVSDKSKFSVSGSFCKKSVSGNLKNTNKIIFAVCVCVYPSSSLGWRYGMNGNSGSCRQPN